MRRVAKKSQAWVAERAGVSAQQWGKYERGEDRIPVGRFNVVRAALEAAIRPAPGAPGFREDDTPYEDEGGDEDRRMLDDIRTFREVLDRLESRIRQRARG